jgi:hypothetical protein
MARTLKASECASPCDMCTVLLYSRVKAALTLESRSLRGSLPLGLRNSSVSV